MRESFDVVLQDLQLALDEQKAHVDQLTQTLEQERQASSQLSQQAEEDHLSLRRRLQELEVQLETERAKALEMSSALGRERELRTSISSDGGRSSEVGAHEDRREPEREGSLLERLQRELDDKHTQVRFRLFSILDRNSGQFFSTGEAYIKENIKHLRSNSIYTETILIQFS